MHESGLYNHYYKGDITAQMLQTINTQCVKFIMK